MFQELVSFSLCACVNRPDYHALVWLSVEYNHSVIRGGEHERDDGKILLPIDNDRYRMMGDRLFKRPYKFVGNRSRGVLYPDAPSGHRRHPTARDPHRLAIDNSDRRYNPPLLQVVRDHITNRIYLPTGDLGNDRLHLSVEFPERVPEEHAVLFGKNEHQRTFSA